MLLILLSWIYTLFTAMVVGVSFNRILKLTCYDSIISIFHGLFGIMLFTGFWAIVFPVNTYFHVVLFLITCFLLGINWKPIKLVVQNLLAEINGLSIFLKSLLTVITILILVQCATAPVLVDNETYYIQTIKWLNEYGLVKGLVNLHLFLGQTSGWHILQSAFNFNFLTDSLNDLSGLGLLLANVFAFTKINTYLKSDNPNRLYLFIGLLPIANLLLFQFISAPSPDLAIYVLSVIVFYQFISLYNTYQKEAFLSLIVLLAFMICIKLTALPFLMFPISIYVKYYKQTQLLNIRIVSLISISTSLLLVKNVIITGNPLHPLLGFESLKSDWHLPDIIATYFKDYGLAYGYQTTLDVFANTSFIEHMKYWLFASGLHGIFNKMIIVLLVVFPLILRKWFNQKMYWIFYITLFITMIILWNTSPQYRFFLPFILISVLMILSLFNLKKNTIKFILVITTILVLITVFIPLNKYVLTDNSQHQETSFFKIDYVIMPHNNSSFPVEYETKAIGNTIINIPTNANFFWETGNTPIPAVSNPQLEYFKNTFSIEPQLRTNHIKDGFNGRRLLKK